MITRIRERVTYANVMATLAMFVALGGASYAAIQLPPGSVGSKQLKRAAVTKPKIARNAVDGVRVRNNSLTGADIRNGSIFPRDLNPRTSKVLAGPQGEQGPRGEQGPTGPAGSVGPVTYVTDDDFITCNTDQTGECLAGNQRWGRAVAIARCPNGQHPLGGGFHLFGITGFDTPGSVIGKVISSEPYADGGAAAPNSWRVVYDTDSVTFEQVRAWAACALVAP